MRHARGHRGFTLVELIIALAIAGALLVVAFGGLRVAVAAWQRGDERVETQQHTRSLTLTLARAVSASYPYAAPAQAGEGAVILFEGAQSRLEFVTQASPFPASVPVAFTAVVIELTSTREQQKLVIRQRILPNHDPFKDAATVLEDDAIKALEFSYLGDGGWQSEWDAQTQGALPRAIRIALGTTVGTEQRPLPALTVTIGTPKR
jgi:prepilin-type N-terminal cleavage/methylation domain-containing protein